MGKYIQVSGKRGNSMEKGNILIQIKKNQNIFYISGENEFGILLRKNLKIINFHLQILRKL